MLNGTLRKKLINICCSVLIEKFTIKVPEYAKIDLAKAIVTIFPKLRDPFSKEGYVSLSTFIIIFIMLLNMCIEITQEAFYTNKNGGEGYIAWRLRTVARSSKDPNIKILIKNRKRKINDTVEENDRNQNIENIEETYTEAVEACIEYMKHASPIDNREDIIAKTEITFKHRRTLGTELLKVYPRFTDMPLLVIKFSLI